jgi:hypothetical protein
MREKFKCHWRWLIFCGLCTISSQHIHGEEPLTNPGKQAETLDYSAGGTYKLEARNYPAGRLLDRGYWENSANMLLGKIVKRKDNPTPHLSMGYEMEVLGDVRGILKPGTHVTVEAPFELNSLGQIPYYKNGAITLMGIVPNNGDIYKYSIEPKSPVGWDQPRLIPPQSVDAVKSALAAIKTVMPQGLTDPLNRAYALELFKSKTYEMWALGASALAAEASEKDVALLMGVFDDPKTDLPRALWINHLVGVMHNLRPDANLQGLLYADEKLQQYLEEHSPQLSTQNMGSIDENK